MSFDLAMIIFCSLQGALAGYATHGALLSLYRLRPKASCALSSLVRKAKLRLRRAKP